MDKFSERRKPRKSRSSRNRKPYGTSKVLEQIFNGERTQNDIIAEKSIKECVSRLTTGREYTCDSCKNYKRRVASVWVVGLIIVLVITQTNLIQ